MEESEAAGGGSFYDKVYQAERPELFFKASPWRVRAHGETVRIRRDARWSVPEPELALIVNARGVIVGYTIGNDMSSRDIEGENPLYLPQAKTYDGSCALGPVMLVKEDASAGPSIAPDTRIEIVISRSGRLVFEGATTLSQMRRRFDELVECLYRETSFPKGCVLLTGTGIIPPDDFTLQSGDEIAISIAPIGTLRNHVE
jgi:2-dehydro-3-deoxy-D-arabinonate dehydratase